MKDRDTFSSKTGFVLACVGSAVGLGNLWLFPWRVGQYGGGTFLVLYLIFVYVLGTTGLMGEYGLGRWAGSGPRPYSHEGQDFPRVPSVTALPSLLGSE